MVTSNFVLYFSIATLLVLSTFLLIFWIVKEDKGDKD